MRKAHEKYERKEFSTEGLTKFGMDCPPDSTGCKEELLTGKQIEKVNNARNELNKNQFNIYESTINTFGAEVVKRDLKISKIDGKLVGSSYPEALTRDYTCYDVPTAFPKLDN